ncbi:NAD+ synthase [bacterium]|nr:NAD+ synthase [bacterium]
MRIALGQINPTVGDFSGNLKKIKEMTMEARKSGAAIIVFPELSISGSPPEDLLFKRLFIQECKAALHKAASYSNDIAIIVGSPELADSRGDKKLYNSAYILLNGKITGRYRKIHLPNYGVFDEKRYFSQGNTALVARIKNANIGLTICEDIWVDNGPAVTESKELLADIIVNLSASPYHQNKCLEREKLMVKRASETGAVICYVNIVGGQDELVFDGTSLIANPDGKIIARANSFEEDLVVADVEFAPKKKKSRTSDTTSGTKLALETIKLPKISTAKTLNKIKPHIAKYLEPDNELYKALVTGTRDYTLKNGFKKVVLGLSGGMDSTLTAVIAVDALGKENVVCVTMPSVFTSEETLRDSHLLAETLGVKIFEVSIKPIYKSYIDNMPKILEPKLTTVTEENIQSRIRGNILMAFSNKYGWLVLATGNKSELAVGYCTLYGDMVGGFAVLKDVPKTRVYSLSRYKNGISGGHLIPQSIIHRKPSAELHPGQLDQDSLPPYAVLDRIIELYIEEDLGLEEIIKKGLDPKTAKAMVRKIDINEFKRRQGAQGIKITPRAFGKDRRFPITNMYKKKS